MQSMNPADQNSKPRPLKKAMGRAAVMLFLSLTLTSCLSMATGAVIGVGVAVLKVPVKMVGKAAGATLGLILPGGN